MHDSRIREWFRMRVNVWSNVSWRCEAGELTSLERKSNVAGDASM